MPVRVVIVGAGHAGGRVAQELCLLSGFQVTVIGAEEHPPYERPRLSKEVLRSEAGLGECLIWRPGDPAWTGAELIAGERVVAIDRARREVHCESGRVCPYDFLVIATGASVREVSLNDHAVHFLRTIEDAQTLSEQIGSARKLLIVGGGFIGLEVAATARSLAVDVTVVEATDRLLGRIVPRDIAQRLMAEHERRGVRIVLGTMVQEVVRDADDAITGAVLTTGEIIPCDMIVVAPGVTPNTQLAAAAGLKIEGGISVDSSMRTSDERIFACGDVAAPYIEMYGQHVRLESWHAAQTQASTIASNLNGQKSSYADVPFYWSDQYEDLSVQVFGVPYLGVRSVHKELSGGSFVTAHIDVEGRLVAVCGLGSAAGIGRRLRKFRPLIQSGTVASDDEILSRL